MLKKYPVLVLILLLTVGFATVTTKLIINGDISAAFDENNFVVVFTRAVSSTGVSAISTDEKSIDFKTDELKNIDDEAMLSFNIANKSRQYDVNVAVNCSLKGSSASMANYLDVTLDNTEPINIKAGSEKRDVLKIKMKQTYSSGLTPEVICTFEETPVSRDTVGDEYIQDYADPILNGADPVLDNDNKLIPVNIANDGTVTMADTTQKWYDYQNKKWANAIILVDEPSQTYNLNDTIKEADIESYFVWIPRYRYLIFNDGNYTTYINSDVPTESTAKEIQIIFEEKGNKVSKGSEVGKWLTHPAFTNYDTNGIWVGKFETGCKGNSFGVIQQNASNPEKVVIKPKMPAWRGMNVSNMFKTSLGYESSLNSHMMRNTEWGAVAYLSHSKYGINDEVRINNNSSTKTGYSANEKDGAGSTSTTETKAYNTEIGYLASTTGNISGIYDMSGGITEYVAGYRDGTPGNSGFTTEELTTYAKHLDVYNANSNKSTYNYRILGDATGEMGPFYYYLNDAGNAYSYINSWHKDASIFVSSWFLRGGGYSEGFLTGQFSFSSRSGFDNTSTTFRVTLAFDKQN